MKVYDEDIKLKFDYPFGSEERSLQDYLADESISHGRSISNLEIIALFANKFGSHEDLKIPDHFYRTINDPILLINGSPPVYLQLRAITRTVIRFAETLLDRLH